MNIRNNKVAQKSKNMGMRMEYNESHLKLLKDTLVQYDEGLVEEAYERLIFEKYDFKDMEALRKEIVRQLNKVLNQREIDRDQFLMKKALLEDKFIKRIAREVYSFVFQEDYLQVCDELDTQNGKGNAIRLDVVKRVQADELNNKRFIDVGIQSVVTEDLINLLVYSKRVKEKDVILSNTNLNSYFGNRRLVKNIDKIFGLIIEIDGVTKEEQVKNLFAIIESGNVPVPNFIINSGHGFHLYYVFEEPIAVHANLFNVYPVINNILNELKKLLWVPAVSNVKPETLNINQGYTVIGTRNRKNRDLIVEAYEVNQSRCSLEYIRSFIDKAEDDPAFDITFPRRSKYTKEEAILLFPNWAVNKFPEAFSEEEREKLLRENEEKRTHRSSVEHGKDYYPANVKVYNWFLKLISDLDNVHHGNRYRCMYALAVYGVKCGISPEVVKEDLLLLLPKYNEIKSNHYDAKYMLDIKDVENALSAYKQKKAFRYTFDWIMEFTGINYKPTTKRREKPLGQSEHLELARLSLEEKYPDGSWRGNSNVHAKQKIADFIESNPEATIEKCIHDTGLSQSCVYRYWKQLRKGMGLSELKKTTVKERIKSYRKENPNGTKMDCVRELGISKTSVYQNWD